MGKLACRLRVIGPDQSVPGVPRAFLRAAFSVAPATLLQLLIFRAVDWSEGQRSVIESTLWIGGALLFVTARRGNGFAGIHELVSHTRVISQVQLSFRPIQKAVRGPQAREEVEARVGPYSVIGALKKTEGSEVLLGHDERLRRNVWIELVAQKTPTVSSARRDLGRPARLRWLNGRRSDEASWDAYEAIDGKPLPEVLSERQSWSVVRYWLLDLSEELHEAMRDGTLPEDGTPISRLRGVWRTFLAWSLMLPLVFFVRNFRINFPRFSFDTASGAYGLALAVLVCFSVGAVWAVMRPERGLHDRVAGTWLVK